MLSDFWKCTQLMYRLYKLFNNESDENIRMVEESARSCGVIGIKLMQFLLMHDGFLSQSGKRKISHVFDQCESHSWKYTVDIYERTFGNDIHDDFNIVRQDKVPIGSGSIGQVYRLFHRKHERYVAVKVKHPHVDDVASRFINNISRIITLVGYVKRIPFALFIHEFLNNVHQQLDYVNEAHNTIEMRKNFLEENHVIIPEIYSYNDHIIIMSHHEGVSFETIKDTPLSTQVSCDIYLFMMSSLINHDFIHCDMHYGNWSIQLLPDDEYKIIIFDCGIIGRSKNMEMSKNMAFATFKGDYEQITNLLIPDVSSKRGGQVLLKRVKELDIKVYKNSSERFSEFIKLLLVSGIQIDANVLRCVQGLVACMSVIFISTDKIFRVLGSTVSSTQILVYFNYLLVTKIKKYKGMRRTFISWIANDPSIEQYFLDWMDNEYGHRDTDVFIDVLTKKHYFTKNESKHNNHDI